MSELDKMSAVKEKSQAIGEFLEWLRSEKGYFLAVDAGEREGGPYMANYNIEQLLAEFFEIDLNKVEQEKRAMLDQLRAVQG